jgi:hypothetical protein
MITDSGVDKDKQQTQMGERQTMDRRGGAADLSDLPPSVRCLILQQNSLSLNGIGIAGPENIKLNKTVGNRQHCWDKFKRPESEDPRTISTGDDRHNQNDKSQEIRQHGSLCVQPLQQGLR